MAFRGNRGLLMEYLKVALKETLQAAGASHFMVFGELGMSDPANLWVMIGYPGVDAYMAGVYSQKDDAFIAATKKYRAVPVSRPIYSRIESMLLLGFENYPVFVSPQETSDLFELRIYEGYSEDAVRRKIKMFNVEEIDLFLRLNMHPVFFGDLIAGPYMPTLVYMLDFKNMATRDEIWAEFIDHPDWKRMVAMEEYANTVSKIHKIFLKAI